MIIIENISNNRCKSVSHIQKNIIKQIHHDEISLFSEIEFEDQTFKVSCVITNGNCILKEENMDLVHKTLEMNNSEVKERNILNRNVQIRNFNEEDGWINFDIDANKNDSYLNYDEIFNKKNEEDSTERSTRVNTHDEKKCDIYISDQEDKSYDPYKIEFDFMENLEKVCQRKKFLDYLKIETENREKNNKYCSNFCCIIC